MNEEISKQESTKKKSKPITVTVIEFLNELFSDDKFNFVAKLAGNYTRIYPETIRGKMSLHE